MTDPEQTVFVVDDDPGVRRSLELLLDSIGLNVKCFASTTEFLRAYDPDAPGCLLLDVRLPTISGLALQEQLREMHSILPIIFITAHADVPLAVRAMHAGAFDFLEKPFNDQELIDRVHAALEHDAGNRAQLGQREEIMGRVGRLTARERQVMEQIVSGNSNKAIAYELGISERTVEIHRSRVMEKMQVSSLAHLVRMWLAVAD